LEKTAKLKQTTLTKKPGETGDRKMLQGVPKLNLPSPNLLGPHRVLRQHEGLPELVAGHVAQLQLAGGVRHAALLRGELPGQLLLTALPTIVTLVRKDWKAFRVVVDRKRSESSLPSLQAVVWLGHPPSARVAPNLICGLSPPRDSVLAVGASSTTPE